jgi:predicted nucleic acid-binding protein
VSTFVDSNIFIYADDDGDAKKQRVAAFTLDGLIQRSEVVISTQVLQEYFSSATRKLRFSAEKARERVVVMSMLPMVQVDPEMVLAAIDLHRLRKLSMWDALIVRAAIAGGCTRLLTEDLNHGEAFDGVKVENPFR